MIVTIVLEKVKPSLRGDLSRWMIEPHPTVFIGNLNAMVRDRLWEKICVSTDSGCGCLMISSTNSEQGFVIRSHGIPKRSVGDFDGLQLIRIP